MSVVLLIKSMSQQNSTSTPELEIEVGLDVLKSLDYREPMGKADTFQFTSSPMLCIWLERYPHCFCTAHVTSHRVIPKDAIS